MQLPQIRISDTSIETRKAMLEFPNCPHLIDGGKRTVKVGREKHTVEQRYCSECSAITGQATQVSAPFCKVTCRSVGGPFMGRRMTEDERNEFVMQAMKLNYGAFSPNKFLHKMTRKHLSETTLTVPDWVTDEFLEAFQGLKEHPLVSMVAITGSSIVAGVDPVPRDIDIVVVVDDMREGIKAWKTNRFGNTMPAFWRGTRVDYYINRHPSGWFVSLDPYTKTVWRSFESKAKIDATVTGGIRNSADFGDYDKLMEELFVREILARDENPEDQEVRDRVLSSLVGETEAEIVTKTEGLRLGDKLAKIIKTVSMGKLDSEKCPGCRARKDALNRIGR